MSICVFGSAYAIILQQIRLKFYSKKLSCFIRYNCEIGFICTNNIHPYLKINAITMKDADKQKYFGGKKTSPQPGQTKKREHQEGYEFINANK